MLEARASRRSLWPSEVRNKRSKVFSIYLELTHENRVYRVEIRSKKGGSFYAMAKGRVVKGPDRHETLLRLIQIL